MTIYLSVAGGIVISVVLPLIRSVLPKPPVTLSARATWPTIRPYVATGLFSLIVALLIVAAMGDQLDTWSTALIAGYTWDSTLQKLTTGNTSAAP
ncbi:MAG: hypothetical protein OEM64_10035 [Gammaproteobacteria bacterium]|nr:hypothetical protein [Gammaproteobacteria bacterium]